MRIYELNEDYFEEIDSEEKAYMLGFIFADGNIQKDKNRLRITLKEGDKEILFRFKELLEYTGDIKIRELKSNQRNTKEYMIAELSVFSKKLISDLNNLGVYPNKTFTIKYPNIPKELDKHFIRGYFDGDGSIYERKDRPNGFWIELSCASKEFLEVIAEKLEYNAIEKVDVVPKRNVYYFTKYKLKAKSILDWLYKDSTIYLQRKYYLYQKFVAPLERNF